MLHKLMIKNFQSHEDTELDLSPHVNVISGTSNSGKSAVVRALRWCLTNNPKGFGFRRHGTAKKTPTDVTITSGENVVSRRRNDTSINGYTVGMNKLEAMHGVVPEEVSATLNMTELNIQQQFSPYFLIGETAGEVARVLNRYTGLEVIDSVISVAVSEQAKIGQEVTYFADMVDQFHALCEDQKPIEALHRQALNLQKQQQAVIVLSDGIIALDLLLEDFRSISQQITNAKQITAQKKAVKEVDDLIATYEKNKDDINSVTSLLDSLEMLEKEYDDLHHFSRHHERVDLLLAYTEQHRVLIKDIQLLQEISSELEDLQYEADECSFLLSFQDDVEALCKQTSIAQNLSYDIVILDELIEDLADYNEDDIIWKTKKECAVEALSLVPFCPLCGAVKGVEGCNL